MTSNNTRIQVRAIRATNGRIQAWVVEDQHGEAAAFLARFWGDAAHTAACTYANRLWRKANSPKAFETP